MPAPGRPKMVYHFIRPGGSIKQELLARQRSNSVNTEKVKKETTSSNNNTLWQKASALRQSLRTTKKVRQNAPHHTRSYSDYGDGRMTDATKTSMYYSDHVPHQDPHRHQRSQRKLTRDSGYETSNGQIEPDYVNSDWLSNQLSNNNRVGLEKKYHNQRGDGHFIIRSQSYYGRDTAKPRPISTKSALPDLPYHPYSHYSSTESLSSCWSSCTPLDDDHVVCPTRSVPDLDQVGDMVTRKFKKGSVYEALASKSGLDFAPVIQGRPYWERREHGDSEDSSYTQKIINKNFNRIRNETNSYRDSKKTYIQATYQQNEEKQISPPPPPIRDSSSLKYIRHQTQTHEKYPSWPAVPASDSDSSVIPSPTKSSPNVASHRSNSWTEQTDYPKERVSYCRPKKGYKISPHQLQPVLERSILENGSRYPKHEIPISIENSLNKALESDSIDLDTFCRSTYYSRQQSVGACDYNIHSPPERDVPRSSVRDKHKQIDNNNQQSYWNNAGDSCTPLLDRLRLESEVMPPSTWFPQVDAETPSEIGNESVDSSNSSQETLKWHGSCSDLSCSNRSSVFDSGHSTLPDRLSPQSCDSSAHIVHSSRVQPAQRHDSESVVYYASPTKSNKSDKTNFSTSFPGFSRNGFNSNHYYQTESISKLKVTEKPSDINTCKQDCEADNRQQKYHYLDPEKRHRISDPELKAIQKQAVLSFYHRQTAAQGNSPNGGEFGNPHESPPVSPGRTKWNQSGETVRLDKVPEDAVLATDLIPSRLTIKDRSPEEVKILENHLSWSVPNLTELSLPVCQKISSQKQTRGKDKLFCVKESVVAKNVHNSKDLPPANPVAISGHLPHNYKQLRKVQLKEFNDKSVVQVITTDGVTIAEALKNQKIEYPAIPPKRINKPVPKPPQPIPSRKPPPPLPVSHQEEQEDDELKRIEEASKGNHTPKVCNAYQERSSPKVSSHVDSSIVSHCSSPDLPLPPPPSTTDTEVHQSDEPLPPPPEFGEVVLSLNMTGSKNMIDTKCSNSSCQNEGKSPNYNKYQIPQDIENNPACNSLYTVPENETISDTECLSKNGDVNIKTYPPALLADSSSDSSPCAKSNISNNDDSAVHISLSYSQEEDEPLLAVSSECERPSSVHTNCETSFSQSEGNNSTSHQSYDILDKQKEDTTQSEESSLSVDLKNNFDCPNVQEQVIVAINGISDTQPNVCLTNSATQTTDTPRLARKVIKSKEELECEKLSRDFINCCGDALLKNLLVPSPNQKTMFDYMTGLLDLNIERNGETVYRNHHRRQLQPINSSDKCLVKPTVNGWWGGAGLPANSAYFTISEPKAKLLTRYSQDINRQEWANEAELNKKKEELIASIGRKLDILRQEQIAMREEVAQNESLGREVTTKVEQLAKPNEIEKYRLHVEELEKIINLLLSLSGRLARAQNALMNLPKEASKEERLLLEAKRDKLSEQHEEARHLKECIDKRSQQVSTFLHRYLLDEEYADYDHFVKMKSKLLMDVREIDEKIKLGEEQLLALRNSVDSHLWTHVQSKSDLSSSNQAQLCRT